jgi:hypothetical protein
MTCEQARRLLSAQRDDDPALTSTTPDAARAHRERCDACRRYQIALDAALAPLRDAAAFVPAGEARPGRITHRALDRWQRERDRADRDGVRAGGRRAVRARVAVAVSAVALVTAAAASLRGIVRPSSAPRPEVGAESAAAGAAAGEPRGGGVTRAAAAPKDPVAGTSPGAPPQRVVPPDMPLSAAAAPRGRRQSRVPAGFPHERAAATAAAARPPSPAAPSRPAPGDDLDRINADPGDVARRWLRLAPEEAASLESRLRASVRGGDDFVSVPLPQIASGDNRVLGAALAAYQREAAIVDPRLSRSVRLAAKATAFSDLCRQLSDQTGISLTASRSVADDKITVFCTDRPLRDLMRQISALFGFTWERTGEEGAYAYKLTQTLRAQLLEEELRNRDRNEALLALDQQMERFRKHLDLTPEQAKALANGASGEDKRVFEALAGAGWGPARLYFGLSGDEMAALRNGQALDFRSSPEKPGQRPLPENLAGNVLQSLAGSTRIDFKPEGGVSLRIDGDASKLPGLPPASVPGAGAWARLELKRGELGQFVLEGGSGVTLDTGQSKVAGFSGVDLGTGISPSVRDPKNAEANAALAADPALADLVTIRPRAPKRPGESDADAASPSAERKVTTADVLEAIHKATGKDVIGDYYTRLYSPGAVSVTRVRRFDALNRIADAMRARWSTDGGGRTGDAAWLRFRSASFFNDRLKEVPNRLLERWAAARREHGALPLDQYVEITQLGDAPLDSDAVAEGVRVLYGLAEWDEARAPLLRGHWRLLGSLSGGLRGAAQGENGVGFAQLPLAQQQQFVALTFGPDANPQPTLEDLAGASLRVTLRKPDAAAAAPTAAGNGGPDGGDRVMFTYRYGGPNTGRRKKEVQRNSVGTGRER